MGVLLFQAEEVGGERLATARPFMPRFGISAPGFMCPGFSIHLATFSGRVGHQAGAAKVLRLPKWVRIGPEHAGGDARRWCGSPRTPTGRRAPCPAAASASVRLHRRRLLGLTHFSNSAWLVHDDAEAHVGVRHAAVLRALARVLAGPVGGERDAGSPGAGPRRACRRAAGIQKEWMTSGACRWKATVCPTGRCSSLAVDDLELRGSGTPTTTAARDVHPQRGGRGRLLRLEDHPDGRDRDDQQDHRERDGPGDLEQGVAVHLLGNGRARAVAEAPARVEQRRPPPR